MAPKIPPAQRPAMVVEYLRKSLTVHTLKDLEKALPAAASIPGMQVKDVLQSLCDEDLVRVEKIGSGNWYWSFGSDALLSRQTQLESLRAEAERAGAAAEKAREEVERERARRTAEEDDNGTDDSEGNDNAGSEDRENFKARVQEDVDVLQREVASLKDEVKGYVEASPAAMEALRREAGDQKARAERWTDNCYMLEDWLVKILGLDRHALEGVRRECYGKEYVEGEGLPEI